MHHPKIESYESYLYLILHCIDFRATTHHFATHEFQAVTETLAYRFRDIYDHLVRLRHGTARSVSLEHVESSQPSDEGVDADRDGVHAAYGSHGRVRHEHGVASASRWPRSAV